MSDKQQFPPICFVRFLFYFFLKSNKWNYTTPLVPLLNLGGECIISTPVFHIGIIFKEQLCEGKGKFGVEQVSWMGYLWQVCLACARIRYRRDIKFSDFLVPFF
jgi:hypothetical protein